MYSNWVIYNHIAKLQVGDFFSKLSIILQMDPNAFHSTQLLSHEPVLLFKFKFSETKKKLIIIHRLHIIIIIKPGEAKQMRLKNANAECIQCHIWQIAVDACLFVAWIKRTRDFRGVWDHAFAAFNFDSI